MCHDRSLVFASRYDIVSSVLPCPTLTQRIEPQQISSPLANIYPDEMSSSQVSLTALESQCLLLLHWSSGAHHISSGLKQKIVVITSIEILGQSHSIQFGFQQFVSRHSKLQDSPLNLPCLLLCYRSVGCILKFNLNLLGSCGT